VGAGVVGTVAALPFDSFCFQRQLFDPSPDQVTEVEEPPGLPVLTKVVILPLSLLFLNLFISRLSGCDILVSEVSK
jgi:hypothetical protein